MVRVHGLHCADKTHMLNCLPDPAAEDCGPVLRRTAALLPPTVHSGQGKIGTESISCIFERAPMLEDGKLCYSSSLYRTPSHCSISSADII